MSGQVYAAPFAQIPEWVLDADISDRAIRVFLTLHRHANERGRAYPGRSKLAERVRCSPASLDRALNELREMGAIHSRHRTANGGVIGNDYWLWPAQPPEDPSSPVDTPTLTGEATPRRVGEATLTRPRVTEREPVNESQQNESQSVDVVTGEQHPDSIDFQLFWERYPRKVGRGAARTSWVRAVKKAAANKIIDAAVRFAQDPNRLEEFTPHPATWLNQERWDDPPLPARTGTSTRLAKTNNNVARLQAFASGEQPERGEIGE